MPARRAGSPVQVSFEPRTENGHLGLAQQLGHGADDLAVAVVERARAADPEQDAAGERIGHRLGGEDRPPRRAVAVRLGSRRLRLAEDGDLEALGPVEARRARLAPWVAGVLHVPEGGVELLRESALLEHRVAADLDDRVDVLDEHRAALDAPAAGRALPDGLLGDGVVHQRQAQRLGGALLRQPERLLRGRGPAVGSPLPRALGRCGRRQRRLRHEDLVAQPLHQVLRREGLAGDRCRAELHASAALGAGQRVEEVPPREVLQALGPEDRLRLALLRLGLEVHQAQRAARLEALRVDVRLAADDVEVLAERQVREERRGRGGCGTRPSRRSRSAPPPDRCPPARGSAVRRGGPTCATDGRARRRRRRNRRPARSGR